MQNVLAALASRFKEPSSWAGVAVILGMFGVHNDPGLIQGIEYLGAGLASVLAFFLPEVKKPESK